MTCEINNHKNRASPAHKPGSPWSHCWLPTIFTASLSCTAQAVPRNILDDGCRKEGLRSDLEGPKSSANCYIMFRGGQIKATSILLHWKPQLESICHLALGCKQSTQSQEPLQRTHWEHYDMIALTCCIYLYRLLSIDFLFTGSHMPSLGLKMHWSKSSVKSPDSNRSLRLHPRTATFEYQLQSYAFSQLLWMLSLRGEHFTIRLLDWFLASQPKISTNSIYTEECCTPENSQIVVLAQTQESICLSSSTQVILGIKGLLAKYIFQQLWASKRARNAFLLSAQNGIIQF